MRMRRFLPNEDGVAAIEFAFIGPVLAMVLLGGFSGWSYLRQVGDMRGAVETVAKYYILGGASETVANTIGTETWFNKPGGGAITASRQNKCGNTNVSSTTWVCPDGNQSQTYVTILATSTWANPVQSDWLGIFPGTIAVQHSEVVRVR